MGSNISSIGRVTGAGWVSSLRCITKGILHVTPAEWLLLVELALRLLPQLVPRHVGNIVPLIVLSRAIDLVEFILGRLDTVGCTLCRIASHIADEDGSIVHCSRVSSTLDR